MFQENGMTVAWVGPSGLPESVHMDQVPAQVNRLNNQVLVYYDEWRK